MSKLHYRPCPSEREVHISMLALANASRRHTVMPMDISPATMPARARTCTAFSLSFSTATANKTVTIGYALDIGTTRDAIPVSSAYVYANAPNTLTARDAAPRYHAILDGLGN